MTRNREKTLMHVNEKPRPSHLMSIVYKHNETHSNKILW